MSSPSTLTRYAGTGLVAGRPRTAPVRIENVDPCWGHSTSSPSSQPSCSSTYSWLQMSWIARNSPSTLPRHTGSLPTTTLVTWPGLTSVAEATRTQSSFAGGATRSAPQLPLDGVAEHVANRLDPHAVDDVLEESLDDEALGVVTGDTPGLEIEELLVVHLADGRSVGAADVVVQYLKLGLRVGLCVVGQNEVAVGLVGVGLLGTGLHPDEARVDGVRPVPERPLVEKVRGAAGRRVVLQRAHVEVLVAGSEVDAEHLDVGVLAADRRLDLRPGEASPERHDDAVQRGIPPQRRPLGAEVPHPPPVLLHGHKGDARARANDDLHARVGQARPGEVAGAVPVEEDERGSLVHHDEC